MSLRTIYRMLERGELHAGKAGVHMLIQRSQIDKFFARSVSKHKPE
ncbi:helix-turn-helix domain-containing protein [Siphonobacter sp. SORGH_AS_0500]